VAYFFTRFPHPTEMVLQREVRALWRLGLRPELHSLHGGGADFEGCVVQRFSKWLLLLLPWHLAIEWWRKPQWILRMAGLLFSSWPRDWLNYWENLFGAGAGVVLAASMRRRGVEHIHAAWASLPAMSAWVVAGLNDSRFSMGAHAYDVFEYGGDWFLAEKCAAAAFVHTETEAGRRRLMALGVPTEKILRVRRGLDRLPPIRTCEGVSPGVLRVVCVARLVEKKGIVQQLRIYRVLLDRGLKLQVRILGDGPLRRSLERQVRENGLGKAVEFGGHLEQQEVGRALAESDVLVHTGVVAASGDRDGLPNVVPEAMAAGAIVVTAPGEGVLEAVEHGVTGLVCPLEDPDAWHAAFVRVRDDGDFCTAVRARAREWVEKFFSAETNVRPLLEGFVSAGGRVGRTSRDTP